MIRQMLDALRWHFRTHRGAGQELYFLRQLTRRAMAYKTALSVDPSGEWSPVQARRVLEIIQSEAKSHGLRFQAIDITTYASPRRFILVAHCIEHDISVGLNELCKMCVQHVDGR